jgi:hypothetical protein
MKKFYVLLVVMALVLSISAISMAAVEVGGNLRVWYKSNVNADSTSISGFEFDRFALKFNASLSDNNGFASEIRIGYRKAATPLADVFVDRAYYYQKNLLTSDELDAGYIPLYFYYNDQYTAITNGSLANKIFPYSATSGAPGLKYGVKFDAFEAALAITNANNTNIKNDASVSGMDGAIRIKVTPMEGLIIGAGYFNDVIDASSNADTYLTVDATLAFLNPVTIYVEFDSKTKFGESAKSGEYLEASLKLSDAFTAYLGGTFGCKTSGIGGFSSDYYHGGVKIQVAPKTALQAEYITNPDAASKNSFNVRLKADF